MNIQEGTSNYQSLIQIQILKIPQMFTQIQQHWKTFLKTVFEKAISKEIRKAKLQLERITLSFGSMTYYSRSPSKQKGIEEAPVILMLHGAGADKEAWLRFAQQLPRQFSLLIPDLPAHGDSDYKPEINYSIQEQTQRLAELIQTLNLQCIHLVGNSMGGAIAIRLAHQHPQWFKSLTLIDTAGAASEPSWLQQESTRTGKNPMMAISSLDDYKTMMQIGMNKPPYIPSVFLGLLAEKRIAKKTQDHHVLQDILTDLDQSQITNQLRLPTLIIWGELDKITHVNDAKVLAQKIVGSELLIIPHIGHVPMVEAPTLVAQRFLHFIKKI